MKRLKSLDALRGFDMIFIMGGASFIAALAALFPDSDVWAFIGDQMNHAQWAGLKHHDTIFPLFLFIAGVTWPFSLENQIMRHRFMTITHISESILILELSGPLRMGLQELNSAISFL